ncbi:flagellar biosynthesis protein FlhB [Idiomarina tyrosinivorans]|uniref:Flagellar biosynthetic protein FlhB n=1 Tax=Idiomarina tyrosinivorans TaxID=1445662 RepID=A0A432ZPN7_9GAMM|nr:EscU/YscU/HrcU family type III secretion system export apparatus switch protein [Idiomarina tyrosinivorans]RUO79796.1 flagellar biosynthesis protein FlhB [Idiomarina tyrosinivorans]
MSDNHKEKQAIGLAYDGINTPKVIARGFDELAEEIIAVAREHGVLVHEDPLLSDSLARLNVGDEIPRDLYIIIAEIIAFAYLLEGKFPASWHGEDEA